MLKMRFGAVPVVEVKMPQSKQFVTRSVQLGSKDALSDGAGRQVFRLLLEVVTNCTLPLELALKMV
jgi:hypothetical protein